MSKQLFETVSFILPMETQLELEQKLINPSVRLNCLQRRGHLIVITVVLTLKRYDLGVYIEALWPWCWHWSVMTLVLTLKRYDLGVDIEAVWPWCWHWSIMTLVLTLKRYDLGADTEALWPWCWHWSGMTLVLNIRFCWTKASLTLGSNRFYNSCPLSLT